MSNENKFLIRRHLEECLAKNNMPLLVPTKPYEIRTVQIDLVRPAAGHE
jgi:hypothetical protein